jgi:hypothetical protein
LEDPLLPDSEQPQHTGVLFIITQQVQPAFRQQEMHSQQAWIISQHSLSPLVQVMQQPLSVGSHRHMPMVRLQKFTGMPLNSTQQLHMPPWSIVQRFCTMLAVTLSSQTQVILKPPVHFSSFRVQRGTIRKLVPIGTPVGAPVGLPNPETPMPGIPIAVRSIKSVLDM